MALMTYSQYAKHRGVSQPYISKLVERGVLIALPGKKIDPEVADLAFERARDPVASVAVERNAEKRERKADPPEDDDESAYAQYNKAKALSEKFRAKMFEIDYRKAASELCEVKSVTRAMFDTGAAMRKMLERLPDRMSARIAAAYSVDARPCHLLLQSEVRDMCSELEKTALALPENLTATKQ